MMFSSNGLIGSNNNDSTAGDPRIVELPSSSPYSGSLDSVLQSGSNNGTIINSGLAQPIITTPETEALSLMPPPPVPVRRTQQQTSDDAMALLSSLGSSATSSSSSAQGAGAANNTSNRSSRAAVTRPRSASGSGSGLAPLPSTLASTSQSLQPLTRATNGARGNVAAFLTKSYNMVSEPGSNNLIKWSDDGQSFVVVNHVEFAKEVLPKFFKHNNFSSFVRQLNMYGFHKVPHLQQGVLMPNSDSEQWEFSNPHFQRNQPDLLNLVSRKKASNNSDDKDSLTMDLDHIMHEVAAIKRHQVAISTDLKNIERDHQSLWQESVAARERHQRQQETIDKILRFLASVFSGDKTRAIIPNKKARLTITDGEVDGSSSADAGRQLVEEEEEEEEEDGRNDILAGGKRKRPSATATTTNDGRQRANYPTLDSMLLYLRA
ncbi:HSF-type DNA-binding-domain-containing protein [Mortierella sp. GBAus27b]|nr:HSF-type DNA-binding-domain-containing protein [Mortierella sp. GBAus27b]